MSVVKEVADGINLVSDTIESLQKIYTAVKDGYQYLDLKHPEIKKDVANMLVELRKTCNAIETASSIMTHFRFNVSPGEINREPTRFNNYFIEYKVDSNNARDLIRNLKGSCRIIEARVHELDKKAGKSTFLEFLGLDSTEREVEVRNALQNIYDEERQWYIVVDKMAENLRIAINEVSDALGPNGMMHANNVPTAALLLNEYAELFGHLELKAKQEADNIQELIDELIK